MLVSYQIRREQEQQKLALINREIESMKNEIAQNQQKISQAYKQLSDVDQPVSEKRDLPNHIQFLKMKNQGLENQLKEALRAHQAQMKSLLEAQKKVKSLEAHKEDQKMAHKKEVLRKEQKTLDDTNSLKRKKGL